MPDTENIPQPEEKKEDVIAEYYDGVKELEKQGYETAIRKARNTLFVTAALVFISEMAAASLQGITITPLLLGIALVEAGVFVGLAFWTKTKPYTAIMTGLVLFIALWVLTAILTDGEAIYKGVIVKAIIIGYLVRALKDAKAWEDLKKR